jgi:hypothetical protein
MPRPRTKVAGPQTADSHREVKSSTLGCVFSIIYFHHGDRGRPNGTKSGNFRPGVASALCGQQTDHAERSKQHDTFDEWCLSRNIRYDTHNVGGQRLLQSGPTESKEMWGRIRSTESGDMSLREGRVRRVHFKLESRGSNRPGHGRLAETNQLPHLM